MKLFIIMMFLSLNLLAQTADDYQRELERQKEMIFKMLGRDFNAFQNDDFEKLIQKFMERSRRDFFQDDNFNQFFKEWNPYGKMGSGESRWLETPKERILIMKMDEMKDVPVDIKINRGVVRITAKKEEKGSYFSFDQTYSIPDDVVATKAVVENNNGEIRVRFPKKVPGSGVSEKANDGKKPVQRGEGEPVI